MGHYFKWMGSREQARQLWENRESLDKYLAVLKEFWDEEKQEWLDERKPRKDVSDMGRQGQKKPR